MVKNLKNMLTPKEIVQELNKYIIGQDDAKKSVAIALRNRYRRMKIKTSIKNEIIPKNILMIGPTGVGKTEIARRIAKLSNAPFIKVEATKFTEIGYVGRDVESIIRDLIDIAVKKNKENAIKNVKQRATKIAEERILSSLLPMIKNNEIIDGKSNENTKQIFKKKLKEGELDEKEIELDILNTPMGIEIMAPQGMEEMTNQLQSMFNSLSGNKKYQKRKLKVKDAMKILREEEAVKLINDKDIKIKSVIDVEENGIVFIDEIDKVTQKAERHGTGEISREGVQRDLLPLIEGCTISTKYGIIKTDHILFITSGAFHLSKPSDLIPELQGRLPIRVELHSLSAEDFVKILTDTSSSLIKQYTSLFETENVKIEFTEDGIKKIASIAWDINENTENIGARRLHTVIEKLLEDISFNTTELYNKTIIIDNEYATEQLKLFNKYENNNKYIL